MFKKPPIFYVFGVLGLLFLFFAVGSAGFEIVKTPLSEAEIQNRYLNMLERYVAYAETLWSDWPVEPRSGFFGNGISRGNEGIRASSGTALAYALLLRESGEEAFGGVPRKKVLDHVVGAIRYIAFTHATGSHPTVDGRKWGRTWQSSLWASNFGMAAWLLWPHLDPDTRKAVKRVVVNEADLFLGRTPPGNEFEDTKAEENAWDTNITSLAANMFPNHPRAERWREKSIEYMMNTLSVERDLSDPSLVDGRTVRDWVRTVNVHPDFTLENHGFFHPVYAMVSAMSLGDSSIYYSFAGRNPPEAVGHHVLDGWNLLQKLALADGEWAYPSGLDWELHDYEHISYFAWLATFWKDPAARLLESRLVQYADLRQRLNGDGRFVGDSVGNPRGFFREAVAAKRIVYAYLHHKLQGPAAEGDFEYADLIRSVRGVHHFRDVDIVLHRTSDKLASFSWGARAMGYVVPDSEEYLDSPYVTTPYVGGFLGRYVKDRRGGRIVIASKLDLKPDRFSVGISFMEEFGALRRTVSFVSLPSKPVIYMEMISATNNHDSYSLKEDEGVPLGIQNDELNGCVRRIYFESGEARIPGDGVPEDIITFPGNWVNIDDRLGVIVLGGGGFGYKKAEGYNRPGAREDILFGSHWRGEREIRAGELVDERIAIILPNANKEATRRIAGSASFLGLPDGWLGLSFEGEDGDGHIIASNLEDTSRSELTLVFDPAGGIWRPSEVGETPESAVRIEAGPLETVIVDLD